MKVLHICRDYGNTDVYPQLFKQLSDNGVNQFIYCPIEKGFQVGPYVQEGIDVVFDRILNPSHHYAYHLKRKKIFTSLQSALDLNSVKLCHAHTLFTDGAQAYGLFKKYGIPYVVAVRNTDINTFMRLLPHTWIVGHKILLSASKIFFISKALMNKFSNHIMVKSILKKIDNKMQFIPNGIDDYFLNHISTQVHSYYGHKIIYIGDFTSNKNIIRLMHAVLKLKQLECYKDISLTLVGGGGDVHEEVLRMVDDSNGLFRYLGRICDRSVICNLLQEHDVFAMPSIHETFGLVYIEALSQNIPVVYTKGQGIDGLFDNSVGIGVNPFSVDDISDAIKNIIDNRSYYSNCKVDFEDFRWSSVAKRYKSYYDDFI